MKKTKRSFYLLLIIFVLLLAFVLYLRVHREGKKEKIWEEVELYLADYVSPDGPFLVPIKINVEKDDVLTSAIDLLSKPPIQIKGVSSPLPNGAILLSAEVKDNTAYLNFSKELKDNFSGGSTTEMLVVYGIVNTACSVKGIEKVQILVEGKVIDSLGGHLEIAQPIEPDTTLVRR